MVLTVGKVACYPTRRYIIIDENGKQLGKPCSSWGQANKKKRVLEELMEEFDLTPKLPEIKTGIVEFKGEGTD
jgi:hypothetical protein